MDQSFDDLHNKKMGEQFYNLNSDATNKSLRQNHILSFQLNLLMKKVKIQMGLN